MNARRIIPLGIAFALVILVMGVSLLLTFTKTGQAMKFVEKTDWSQDYPLTQSMKIIDLNGDKQDDLFLQNLYSVRVLDAQGNSLFDSTYADPLSTSMGDVNGDGVEDIVVATGSREVKLISNNQELWNIDLSNEENISVPSRVAVVRFPEGTQVVVGDDRGRLIALGPDGQILWRVENDLGDIVRGLDDVLIGGKIRLAAANHDGAVAVYDAAGQETWRYQYPGLLRRLRAYDLNGDGTSEVLIGGEANSLVMLSAADGSQLKSVSLGQVITEIRDAELDGNPSSREFVVGGKKGGVWAFKADGSQFWFGSVSGKVNEIVALEIGDQKDVLIGDDQGEFKLFQGSSGSKYSLDDESSGIARLDVGKLAGKSRIALANAAAVKVLAIELQSAPIWYSPLLAGMIISAIILLVGGFIAALPSKAPLKVTVEDQSVEGVLARRRMVKENIADVERLRQSGEMPPDAYLARLKELRSDLAEAEAALIKSGTKVQVETMVCPHCGGTLPLGMDKCEYCGQVVIT